MAAKNYTEILELVNAGSQMGLSNTIKRDYGIPLDFTSVQPSLAAAIEYAATNTKAYVGQPLSVGSKLYIITDSIQPAFEGVETDFDNYLAEVGSKTEGDGATIDLEDGVLKLYGIDLETTVAGMLPQVEVVDGQKRLKWVAISSFVEGDGNKITTLTSEDGSVTITKKTDTEESLVYDLSVTHPTAPEYAIAKDERAEGATETTYHLTKDGTNVDVAIVVPDAYNDSVLAGRVKSIEDDYVKASEYTPYDDTALAGRVTNLENAGYQTATDVINLLNPYATTEYVNTEVAKKADKSAYDQTVLDLDALEAKVDAFLSGTGAEGALDSLQELIEYIDAHDGADLTELIATVNAIENKLEGIDSTVVTYVTAAIDALKIGDYAKAADLTALAGRVEALEAKPFDTYATKTEVAEAASGARSGAVADVAAVGYALASEVENTYATKQSVTDLGNTFDTKLNDYAKTADVNNALAKKIETGSIAHSSESLAEGVTVDGTKLNIVVDAYTKQEVRDYVADVIEDMTGGESAADVLLALNNHIDTYTEKVGQIDAKDAAQDTAIAKAQEDATKGINDAKKANDDLAALIAGDIATHTSDLSAIKGRLTTLETAKGDHETRLGVAEGKITALEAEDAEINETLGTIAGQITALQGEDSRLAGVIATKADASAVYTKEEADQAIKNAIDAIPEVDLKDYAKTADVAATYATIANLTAEAERADAAEKANANAIAAIYKAGEGENAATGVLADEIARAQAAEKKLSDDLALLINNPTEDLDSVVEIIEHVKNNGTAVAGIIGRLDGHDAILAGFGGENQPATVVAAIATAKQEAIDAAVAAVPTYELPAATKDALGGVKLSDEVGVNDNGQLEVKAVSTDKLVNGVEELVLNGGSAKAVNA
jgi:hypothetical protein